MRRSTPAICAALLGMAATVTTGAAQITGAVQTKPSAAIPATAPTQSVSDLPSARPAAGMAASATGSSHVTWTGATLAIEGGGDSLRSILVQVMRETGMKVTGGIPDERVFGKYGPAPVQQVLAELFDGLSVNLLLLNDSPTRPKELVLTARTGGVTPPMANPIAADEASRSGGGRPVRGGFNGPPTGNPAQQQFPPQAGVPGQPPNIAPNPIPQPDSPAAEPPSNASPDANGASGARTPEQIFEELRKRQQQGTGTTQ